MTAFNSSEIIQGLSEKLAAYYVFPEIAGKICLNLQHHLEAGEYADITEGDFFALALTMHMQEINHDEHLWVRWHAEPLPDDDGQLRLNREWQAARQREAAQDNFGLGKFERLPGNIGHIEIRCFHRETWARETYIAAMATLVKNGALIIDLRGCTGGYPDTVALICSYLFGAEPLLIDSIYWRDEDRIQEYWTTPGITQNHFGSKPVFVLTSKVTFSAGEQLAHALKVRKRAVLVGEKTDGGAHPGVSYRLHPHFEVFIPIGRVINPITGSNWEKTGVEPDVPVPPAQAFDTAYCMALESIIEHMGKPSTREDIALLDEVRKIFEDYKKI